MTGGSILGAKQEWKLLEKTTYLSSPSSGNISNLVKQSYFVKQQGLRLSATVGVGQNEVLYPIWSTSLYTSSNLMSPGKKIVELADALIINKMTRGMRLKNKIQYESALKF